MITEIYTGHPIRKIADRFLPFNMGNSDAYTEYIAPDFLQFSTPLPCCVYLHYKGSRDNFDIVCETPHGQIPLKILGPEGTTFRLGSNDWRNCGYRAVPGHRIVQLPLHIKELQHEPIYRMFHEFGHIWSYEEEEWRDQLEKAHKLIEDWSIPRDPRNFWLPKEDKRRELEFDAHQIMREEERRSWGIAIHLIKRLREQGLDVAPHLKRAFQFMRLANAGLKSHGDHYRTEFRFKRNEVEQIVKGNSPWSQLLQMVDTHLEGTIT